MLATGSGDHTIKLWEVATGRELRTLTGHSHIITFVAFSADGQTLTSASLDKTVKSWDVASGRELTTIDLSVASAVLSADATMLASGSDDGTIRLWDTATGRELHTLRGHSAPVTTVAFSTDGKTLASGSDRSDTAIWLWNVATGRELRRLTGHSGRVRKLAFSADGRTLASSGGIGDTTIRLWDVATGHQLITLVDDGTLITSIAFSPDGKTLASGGYSRTIKLWDVATGRKLRTLTGSCASAMIASVDVVAFSGDGKKLASGTSCDGTLNLWDAVTGRELLTTIYSDSVRSVAFTADRKALASIAQNKDSFDSTIKLWDVATGMGLRTLTLRQRNSIVALSGDGKTLASGAGSYPRTIKLWNVSTGRELHTLSGHFNTVHSIAFSPDGKMLASGSMDKTIMLWDVATGRELHTLSGHTEVVYELAFSADGKTLASASADGTIKLWDAAQGKDSRTLTSGSRRLSSSLVFTADGKTLASGGWDNSVITLWDVDTGSEVRSLAGNSGGVNSIAFNVDGKILASSSRAGTITLWDVDRGRELRSLTGHSLNVNSVAFSANGKFLISGSDDASIRLWRVDSGKLEASLTAFDEQGWIAITPNGLFDGSPAAWNKVIWRFNNNTFNFAPVEAFFSDFYYPGLLVDIFAGKNPKAPADISQKDRRPPQLKLMLADAEPGATLATRNVTVKVEVLEAPAGAHDVRLFRNGSLVKVWHGDVLKGQSSVTLEAQVPIVAGENKLTAYAFNHDNIKSGDVLLVINGADNLRRAGTLYVLAIGVNKYASAGHDLRFAVADVDEMSKELEVRQHKLGNYARTEVISLLDRQATKANLKLAMQRFVDGPQMPLPRDASPALQRQLEKIKKADPEDALIIHFAGHGTVKDQHFYLLPHDFVNGSEEQVKGSSVSDLELNEILEGVGAGKLLMVIDACQSGQALGGEKEGRGPMNSKGLAQLAYDKGMYILTAAQSYQAAKEVSRSLVGRRIEHGLLTFALLEGLIKATADSEGRISEREWMNYAVEQVPLMQTQEMKKRNLRNRQGGRRRRRGAELVFAVGDNGNLDPEERNVQRPRVFYRRELEDRPLFVAKR